MFGHKCFLRIGKTNDHNVGSPYKSSYELLSCNFGFAQGMDNNGKAQSDVHGGTLHIVLPSIPPDVFINWMLKSGKLEDGAIVVCDANDMPLEKMYFEGGACTQMDVSYVQKGEGYIATKLQIQARKVTVGNVSLEKRWINLK